MKILFDTGVFISYFGRKSHPIRTKNAKLLVEHIKQIGGEILYSQRTYHELKVINWEHRHAFLKQCKLAKYHYGNEKINNIDGTWENIESIWNNDTDGEYQLSLKLTDYLIDDTRTHDRGILIDAIINSCKYFIHENPNDFNSIPKEITNRFNITVLDLLESKHEVINIIK